MVVLLFSLPHFLFFSLLTWISQTQHHRVFLKRNLNLSFLRNTHLRKPEKKSRSFNWPRDLKKSRKRNIGFISKYKFFSLSLWVLLINHLLYFLSKSDFFMRKCFTWSKYCMPKIVLCRWQKSSRWIKLLTSIMCSGTLLRWSLVIEPLFPHLQS